MDPLSEKYAYQSHYNFSENRVVDGVELEGLEFFKTADEANDWAGPDRANVQNDYHYEDNGKGKDLVQDIKEVSILGKAKGGYVSLAQSYDTGNESGFNAMSTGFNANGKYAGFESNIKGGSYSYFNNTGNGLLPLAADLGAEV